MSATISGVFKFGDPSNVQAFKPALTETLTGRIEFFLPHKFFGFIIRDDTKERLYFHGGQLQGCRIFKNDRVQFSLGTNIKGTVARKISLIIPPPTVTSTVPPAKVQPAASAMHAVVQPSSSSTHQAIQPSSSAQSINQTQNAIGKTMSTKRTKPEPDVEHDSPDNETPACSLCDDEPATITFHPCNHKICCLDCSIRIKKCVRCNKKIENKTKEDGMLMMIPANAASGLSSLIAMINAQEEAQLCSICFDQKKSIVFNCGHLACAGCANSIERCHLCQRAIQMRTRIYEF